MKNAKRESRFAFLSVKEKRYALVALVLPIVFGLPARARRLDHGF